MIAETPLALLAVTSAAFFGGSFVLCWHAVRERRLAEAMKAVAEEMLDATRQDRERLGAALMLAESDRYPEALNALLGRQDNVIAFPGCGPISA